MHFIIVQQRLNGMKKGDGNINNEKYKYIYKRTVAHNIETTIFMSANDIV